MIKIMIDRLTSQYNTAVATLPAWLCLEPSHVPSQ